MTVNALRARFDALVQITTEMRLGGQLIPSGLTEEIKRLAAENPYWFNVVVSPTQSIQLNGSPPRAAQPHMPGVRNPIVIAEEMEPIINEVLKTWGARYCVFQAGGKLFEIQIDKSSELKFLTCTPSTPRLLQVGPVRARVLASRECDFQKEKTTKDGTPANEACLPPEWLGAAIVTSSSFNEVPILSGLACAPTLRRDGALIWERGYDASTGIYLASNLKVDVPEHPSQAEAQAAMGKLLDLVADFDFVNPAGKSVWVAGVLSIAARHTFEGPVPIIIVDASKRGSGKTTLVDVASIIATGVKTSRMFYTDDDVEMDKRITALALAGEQTVLIDNIVGKLASPPLDAALTSDSYKGRVLGKSEMTPAIPMKIVWFATGNGLIIGADTARRAILARLEPTVDRPEDRVGPRPGETWKHPRLLDHVTTNRTELLSAALTVVKAYIQAGRPDMKLAPMGSFEAWSDTIRAAIVWAGAADPCATIKEAREADLEDHALRLMIENWPVKDTVVTAATLIDWAITTPPMSAKPEMRAHYETTENDRERWRSALLEWLPAKKGDLPTPRELGYALRSIKGSVIGNFKIEALPHTSSGIPWQRIQVSGDDSDDISNSRNSTALSLVRG